MVILSQEIPRLIMLFTDYFQALLGSFVRDLTSSSFDDIPIPNMVPPEGGESLCVDFSPTEVKETIFSCEPNKTPGPGGFNVKFFQHLYSVIDDEFSKALMFVLSSNTTHKARNATNFCLIPKNNSPSSIHYFRPISCCNTMAKCNSKLLAKRLELLLPTLISPTQIDFIQDHSIMNNLLTVHELVEVTRGREYPRDVL